jgi:autotransporter-associated beta strand protein
VLALAACGGGGGNVRPSTPTPPSTPGGTGFTPTVANDSAIVVNPPAIPTLGAPATWAAPSINRHLSLTNANHPTLSGRVTSNFIHVSSPPNNTSVDDVVGHGTTVASLAAGKPATGVYSAGGSDTWGGGIAQGAGVVSSRIIGDARPDDDGSGEGNEIRAGEGYGEFFQAINAELAGAGAKIINNSWGGLYWNDPALSIELANAWKDFVVTRGGIVVFANGNSGDDPRFVGNPSDNAALPSIANDPVARKRLADGRRAGSAQPDPADRLFAAVRHRHELLPGRARQRGVHRSRMRRSQANSVLYQGGGTSYAAPLVSGAAAVVWSAFPYFSNDQVRQTVLAASRDLGAPGVDSVFGWGLLDVTKAAMGPSNFAWGDFSVSFSGNSIWRNPIIGSGGLIKGGSGTLTLAEAGNFTGATRVDAGGLDVRKGLRSNLGIASGATVWASGVFGGNVSNSGRFYSGASSPASISGNFIQSSTGNLGVWLGSSLRVTGTATLDGQMSILGVRSGYTTTAKETLLNATGGVSGTFSALRAASNVFLDASLAYDPNNVFLNINRINVANAVAGMSLSTITQVSAARVESAMSAIDGQLAGTLPVGIGAAFIDAAGALQQASSIANADVSLRSLSGQLHGASAAMTFDAIDAGRRALDGRLDALSLAPHATGGWYRDLSSGGTLAQAGFDSVGIDAAGEMIGNDWRVGRHGVVGIALNRLEQSGWLSDFGDRSRGRQRELQVYAATPRSVLAVLPANRVASRPISMRPDLVGAGADGIELGVAQDAAGGVFVDVAVAAQRLDRFQRHLHRGFGGMQQAAGGVDARSCGRRRSRARPGRRTRALDCSAVYMSAILACMMPKVPIACVELLALAHVGQGEVHRRLHQADRAAAQHQALGVQAAHQHLDALVDLAEHVLRRDLAVLEHQLAGVAAAHAQLVELLRGGETLHALLDDEGGHALAAQLLAGGAHVDHQHVGLGAVGDPHLVAVGDPHAVLQLGAAGHRADHVGTGARFAHRQRALPFAAAQLRQVLRALRLVAVGVEVVDAQVGMRAVAQADRAGRARDFLHRHQVGEVAHLAAAELARHGDAEQAHLAELRPQVLRERVVFVDLRRARRDLGLGEAADRLAQGIDVFAEGKWTHHEPLFWWVPTAPFSKGGAATAAGIW